MVTHTRSRNVHRARARSRGRGFTYVWVLAATAVLGIGLLAVSEVWVTSARRQRSVELDWIGGQFVKAVGSYYQSTPGAAKVYPKTLQELLDDRRYLTTRRHLRSVYLNPFTAKADWDLVTTGDGRIQGIRATVPDESGGARTKEYVYRPG
jgi:type II secretory pathway pseudopilin PulG